MPEPGNTTTPIGMTSRSWSLRLNGAAQSLQVEARGGYRRRRFFAHIDTMINPKTASRNR